MRCARLMNAWGPRLSHTIVSAVPEAMAAAALIKAQVPTALVVVIQGLIIVTLAGAALAIQRMEGRSA